jgi:hypothetical protein
MKKQSAKLLWFSIAIAFYFLALYLVWIFKVDVTIIGVFQEMLTIPMGLGLLALVIVTSMKLVKPQSRTTANILALVIALATLILIIQSF